MLAVLQVVALRNGRLSWSHQKFLLPAPAGDAREVQGMVISSF